MLSPLLVIGLLFGGVVPPQTDFYVSASGSDSNAGTITAPWQTISKVNSSAPRGANVYLNGGDSFYGQLVPKSSSSFSSYGSGMATISGGVAVTTWTLFDAGKGIWRASYSAATSRPRNLWVNGTRVTRPSIAAPTGLTKTSGGFSSASSSSPGFLSTYAQPDKLEFIFRMLWQEQRVPVTAVSGNSITLQPAAWTQLNFIYDTINILGVAVCAWRVENAYEIFYAAGSASTFFHDEAAGFIYLIPPAGVSNPNSATIIAPVLNSILNASAVTDVSFTGLKFSYVNTTQPTDPLGFVDLQSTTLTNSTGNVSTASPSGMLLTNCSRVAFTGNVFEAFGINAIQIRAGCFDVSFIGNVFRDLSGVAISDGDPTTPNGHTERTTIQNNLFQDLGLEFRGAPALIHWFGVDFLAEHNHVRRAPYTGISSGWGWSPTQAANRNTNPIVRLNKINDVMLELKDGGAIYLNAAQSNALTDSNWIYSVGNSNTTPYGGPVGTEAIYLDNGSSGHTVTNNVSYLIGGDYPDYAFNDNFSPATGGGNVTDSGTKHLTNGSAANTVVLTAIGLSAAQAAGIASGAGLESAYAHLDTDYP